jgi:hypothetical protein
MWADKTTTGVYGARDVKAAINSADINKARVALIRLKWLMGARKYMKVTAIKNIFKKQKERIGDILDDLDTALTTQPAAPGFTAWQKQGLKAYWDAYMNEKFKTAKSRVESDMDNYLILMNLKWGPKVCLLLVLWERG